MLTRLTFQVNKSLLGMGSEVDGGRDMPESRVSASPRRRRNAAATRGAILEAARRRFAIQGYERAGVREIAADAGVTAALVNRYFGSKEGLFAQAIAQALDMKHLLNGRGASLPDHLAPVIVYGHDDSGDRGACAPVAPAAFRRGARRAQAIPPGPRPQRAPAYGGS
jgi:AcrR family transcriptional regulator